MTENELKDAMIKKHLEGWDGMKRASIDYFAQTGKASGSFYLELKKMLDEYAQARHLARLEITEKEIDEIATQYDNGGLNQSQWVGFTWGAKAVLEKLKQT